MWASRWSPAIRIRRSASQKRVSEGLWPGRCRTSSRRSPRVRILAVGERAGHGHLRAPAAEAAGDAAQRRRHVLGDAVAQHHLDRELVLELGVLVEVGEPLGGDPERRHLGAGVLDQDLDQAEVVDVLVGDDDQLEVVDRVAALVQLRAQLVERLAGVGAGVDQGQRLVLDQVALTRADRERGRRSASGGCRPAPPARAPPPGSVVTPGSAPGPRRGAAPCPRASSATRGSAAAAARCSRAAR